MPSHWQPSRPLDAPRIRFWSPSAPHKALRARRNSGWSRVRCRCYIYPWTPTRRLHARACPLPTSSSRHCRHVQTRLGTNRMLGWAAHAASTRTLARTRQEEQVHRTSLRPRVLWHHKPKTTSLPAAAELHYRKLMLSSRRIRSCTISRRVLPPNQCKRV